MKQLLTIIFIAASLTFTQAALAQSVLVQPKANEVDGSAAIFDLLVEVLYDNIGDAELDCEQDFESLGRQIVNLSNNKKLSKSASAKAVKSFLKLVGIKSFPSLLKEASVEAAIQFCDGSEYEDEEPAEDEPEFE